MAFCFQPPVAGGVEVRVLIRANLTGYAMLYSSMVKEKRIVVLDCRLYLCFSIFLSFYLLYIIHFVYLSFCLS